MTRKLVDMDIDANNQGVADEKKKKKGRSAPVLPWMKVPLTIDPSDGTLLDNVGGLDPRLSLTLNATNVQSLFPVQTVVWEATAAGSSPLHDICLSAPTGSGKTLAYCLPIIQYFASTMSPPLIVDYPTTSKEKSSNSGAHTKSPISPPFSTNTKLFYDNKKDSKGIHALIVLPTRDLAMQVFDVLAPLCTAIHIPCFAACGRLSVAEEACILSRGSCYEGTTSISINSSIIYTAGTTPSIQGYAATQHSAPVLVVATPGRLSSHLDGSPGFSKNLSSLRFLVVDEADRLLRQSYQGWLQKLLSVVSPTSSRSHNRATTTNLAVNATTDKRLIKFIVSATLTRDPSKLERLQLHSPRYVAMTAEDHRYKLPSNLEESKIVIAEEQKPLFLTALIASLGPKRILVFASAVETTRRITVLLSLMPSVVGHVAEYSAARAPDDRRRALRLFKTAQGSILVCSDAMTRGIDVEDVDVVINYDAPVYAKTYVHRAGRTARAGRGGHVITLLKQEDVRHFKAMLRKADNSYVKDYSLEKTVVNGVRDEVREALENMKKMLVIMDNEERFMETTTTKRQSGGGGGVNMTGTDGEKGNNAKKRKKNHDDGDTKKRKANRNRCSFSFHKIPNVPELVFSKP